VRQPVENSVGQTLLRRNARRSAERSARRLYLMPGSVSIIGSPHDNLTNGVVIGMPQAASFAPPDGRFPNSNDKLIWAIDARRTSGLRLLYFFTSRLSGGLSPDLTSSKRGDVEALPYLGGIADALPEPPADISRSETRFHPTGAPSPVLFM
jgi:hypothetical protein